MTHLGNNIKIIRALCKKTQRQFASLFEDVTEAMQKSYEGGKARPSILYMERLAELSGVTVRNLTNAQLTRNSFKINTGLLNVEEVEKVEKVSDPVHLNGAQKPTDLLTGANVTLQDYIDDLRRDKETLYSLANSILDQIKLDTKTALAYQMAWVEYEAERTAKGDEQMKREAMHKMNTLVRSYLPGRIVASNESGTGKHDKD